MSTTEPRYILNSAQFLRNIFPDLIHSPMLRINFYISYLSAKIVVLESFENASMI